MYIVVNKNKKKIVKVDEEIEIQAPNETMMMEGFKLPLVNVEVSWWVFLIIIVLIVLIGVLIYMAFQGDDVVASTGPMAPAPVVAVPMASASMAPAQVASVPMAVAPIRKAGAKKKIGAKKKKN
jgi:hypothetical protein